MGRRSHVPDPLQRRQVEALAGYGVPEAEIAGMMAIDPKTLRKHYRHELDHGHTKANAKVAENLFRKATGEGREAVTAAIFWLKARARWKETTQIDHGGQPDRRSRRHLRRLARNSPPAGQFPMTRSYGGPDCPPAGVVRNRPAGGLFWCRDAVLP